MSRRLLSSSLSRPITWGVAGDGRVAADWCEAMRRMQSVGGVVPARVGAVGAPQRASASAFAEKHAPGAIGLEFEVRKELIDPILFCSVC